jgi:hypothetical protein
MPGPAPKPVDTRRRRNAPLANTLRLPAEGRTGDAPDWPLRGDAPDIWSELWATPQAVAWERLGWTRVVARYVNVLSLCEDPESMNAALLGEARQLEDRLGLSPMAMLRLRWEVAADEVAEQREAKPAQDPRKRLKVADGSAVAGS